MQPEIAEKLRQLNHQFYQTFAGEFAATRQRLQPGVQHILQIIPSSATVLDLGCGNGELARALAASGHTGHYLGLDFSGELLAYALQDLPEGYLANFQAADLAAPDWDADMRPHSFGFILAFATLHHLPGEVIRALFLRKIHNLLAPNGRFIHSNWQFLNSQRLAKRIQPWASIDLTPADVDPGDYLLDWRRGGKGLRYVHHFTPDELAALADQTGFTILETFLSDGEGGKLGLYGVWEKLVG